MPLIYEIKSYKNNIPQYDGNPKQLAFFIKRVEKINALLNSIPHFRTMSKILLSQMFKEN